MKLTFSTLSIRALSLELLIYSEEYNHFEAIALKGSCTNAQS